MHSRQSKSTSCRASVPWRQTTHPSGGFSLDGIAPAPRGVPQIEVSFDIDANGIITVTAKDQATQREQHITVTGRSGMSEEDIKAKVSEAEENAEADRLRREAVDTRNLAESTAYQADKLIEEHGERLPEDIKSDIQSKASEVRTVLADQNADAERVKAASEALQQAMMAAGQHIQAEAAAGAGAQQPGGTGPDAPPDDDTVEGRFREV